MQKNKAAVLCRSVMMESTLAYALDLEDGRIEDPRYSKEGVL
jgi:hypothetical protein